MPDDKSYLQNIGLQTCLMVSVTNKTQTYMSDSRAGFSILQRCFTFVTCFKSQNEGDLDFCKNS